MRLVPVPDDASAEDMLRPFLAQTVNWSIDSPPLSDDQIAADGVLAGYLDGWGRPGDTGVVVLDDDERAVGAAWVRLPHDGWRGLGWAGDQIPELRIAVDPAEQGHGYGTHLLRAVLDLLRLSGRGSISLAVHERNTAGEFFAENGFVIAGREGDADILLRSI
ncbi:MAG TPA: GNAT family N-acetyltransferase [Brevibacterium sp.]|nr:GNAT family N-acetyltransferase [Brevibacterium sp.]